MKFLKSFIIYFFGYVVSKIIMFLLLPIATRYFSTGDYGYFDLLTANLNIIIPVLFIEVWNGILRFLFDFNDDKKKKSVIASGMTLAMLLIVPFTAGFFVFRAIEEVRFPVITYIYCLATMLVNVYQFIARGLGENTTFIVSGVINALATGVINIVLIVSFKMGIESMLVSAIAGSLASVVFIETQTHVIGSIRKEHFDKTIMKNIFLFSAPLLLNSVAYWMIGNYNRTVIEDRLGLEANGIYAAANKFALLLNAFSSVFSLVWQETAYSMSSDTNRGEKYTAALNYFIRFLGGAVLVLIPAIYICFPYIVGSDYADAKALIPLFVAGTFFTAMSGFVGNIFGAEKKTSVIFITTIIGAVVSLGVIYTLIPHIGLQAATLSLALGFLAMFISRIYFINKTVKVKIDLKASLLWMAGFAAVCLAYYKTGTTGNAALLVFMTGFWLVFNKELAMIGLNALKQRKK